MRYGLKTLLVGLIASYCTTVFAGNEVHFLGLNEGQIEIFRLENLPQAVKENLRRIEKTNKSGDYTLAQSTEPLLKHYGMNRKTKVVSLGSAPEIKEITIGKVIFHFKSKGDCSNYPDQFLTLSFSPNLESFVGVVLPSSATILTYGEDEKRKAVEALKSYFMKSDRKEAVAGGQLPIDKFVAIKVASHVYLIMGDLFENALVLKYANGAIENAGSVDLKMCGT